MTQNKLDGPQSGKLCKTYNSQREAARGGKRWIRPGLGGHGNAQMGKEGRGRGLE